MLIPGTLKVRVIAGARGEFAVGELITPLGEFKVKDPFLDQFDAGTYKGRFDVTSIYLGNYTWKGRAFSEVRAKVAACNLDEGEPESGIAEARAPGDEPDPIVESSPASVEVPAAEPPASGPASVEPQQPTTTGEVGDPSHDPNVKLFGAELWELICCQRDVKLDPTVDRGLFRQQRDSLKALGYRFDSTSQSWSRTAQ